MIRKIKAQNLQPAGDMVAAMPLADVTRGYFSVTNQERRNESLSTVAFFIRTILAVSLQTQQDGKFPCFHLAAGEAGVGTWPPQATTRLI